MVGARSQTPLPLPKNTQVLLYFLKYNVCAVTLMRKYIQAHSSVLL